LTPGLILGLDALLLGVILWLAGPAIERRWPDAGGWLEGGRVLALLVGFALVLIAIAPEQTPGSGVANPVPNTVTSVTRGADLYQANCAACHGVDARSGGPQAGSTPVRPPDLRSGHLDSHTDGDIYYWLTNGLPGGMPAWESTLSETDRWHLVNYLRSINGRPPEARELSGPQSQDAAGLAFLAGFSMFFGGWLISGLWRGFRSRRRLR
jgi:mono/diheme cytochrome c family protein